MAEEPQNPKYVPPKPFPLIREHKGLSLDIARIKEEYLNQPHYAWKDFCLSQGYPAKRTDLPNSVPIKFWQREWVNRQCEVGEESIMEQAVIAKLFINKGRIEFPEHWNAKAKTMESLADYMLNQHLEEAQWDQAHIEEIKAGKQKRKFTLTPRGFNELMNGQERAMDMARQSLLFGQSDAYKILPVKDADPEIMHAEAEGERLRAMETGLIGGGTLDENKMTAILEKWIDQKAIDVQSEVVEDENAPLDELTEP